MIQIRYIDELNYGKVNDNHDLDAIFNSSSSSSSIDEEERATRKQKKDLLLLMQIYLDLPEELQETINSYFQIPVKIRQLIEYKATHQGQTQSEVAEALGISRQTLYNRINELKDLGDFTAALQLISLKALQQEPQDYTDEEREQEYDVDFEEYKGDE